MTLGNLEKFVCQKITLGIGVPGISQSHNDKRDFRHLDLLRNDDGDKGAGELSKLITTSKCNNLNGYNTERLHLS